jgi:hypothetical protein
LAIDVIICHASIRLWGEHPIFFAFIANKLAPTTNANHTSILGCNAFIFFFRLGVPGVHHFSGPTSNFVSTPFLAT